MTCLLQKKTPTMRCCGCGLSLVLMGHCGTCWWRSVTWTSKQMRRAQTSCHTCLGTSSMSGITSLTSRWRKETQSFLKWVFHKNDLLCKKSWQLENLLCAVEGAQVYVSILGHAFLKQSNKVKCAYIIEVFQSADAWTEVYCIKINLFSPCNCLEIKFKIFPAT